MRTNSLFLTLCLFVLLLGSQAATAQVSVRIGLGYPPPRAYYGPRHYYAPRPAVVYAVPPPVVVAPGPYYAPRPVYYAPRPVYYAPRPYYYRGRRW